MIALYDKGAYLLDGKTLVAEDMAPKPTTETDAKKGTITYKILEKHNTSNSMEKLALRFDSLASHDLTYVGVIQTVKASGLKEFPVPYVLTNCHNSLCAVGGTLNRDDHMFGLSAARKYGGIYVPAHQAVIHSYMREMYAACGDMILGTDSHTRYGALGTLAIGEGGGELAKQLLKKTYDIAYPQVVAVYLKGKLRPGVGPQDVALAIIGAVFENGYVKNKVMEFVGEGVSSLSADFRNGIDVMTTETACLSSIWRTDEVIEKYYETHGRASDYRCMEPDNIAYYDGAIEVDLSGIKPMIALPFHPSNAYAINEFKANAGDILREIEKNTRTLIDNPKIDFTLTNKLVNGQFHVDQGVIAGCAGGLFENIVDAAAIIGAHSLGNGEFSLSVYPASQPVMMALSKQGVLNQLMANGAIVRTAFCGPCFGAGDVPANGEISIRHTTRNFPNREGSKPGQGQMAAVALMDARSIAATAVNGGVLTAATELAPDLPEKTYHFDDTAYRSRIYNGFGKPIEEEPLRYGPNIVDWPEMAAMEENWLLGIASVIHDPVTTTDELIPSGDTSTYRSNPVGMAEFTLSRKDPKYVANAKRYQAMEKARISGDLDEVNAVFREIHELLGFENVNLKNTGLGSVVYAQKPGDGSAREQAASCQRVLGGCANIAKEYATKRYRSNLINWGMLPLLTDDEEAFAVGGYVFLPGIRKAVLEGARTIEAYVINGKELVKLNLKMDAITEDERAILAAGCLINYYKS